MRSPTDNLFSLFIKPMLKDKPAAFAEMNSDPPSLFDYVSEANVFVTATSLLPNGELEILEVHMFDRERIGVLVSFCIEVLILLAMAHGCRITRFSLSPLSFP